MMTPKPVKSISTVSAINSSGERDDRAVGEDGDGCAVCRIVPNLQNLHIVRGVWRSPRWRPSDGNAIVMSD
jgi:hypothetical protein